MERDLYHVVIETAEGVYIRETWFYVDEDMELEIKGPWNGGIVIKGVPVKEKEGEG